MKVTNISYIHKCTHTRVENLPDCKTSEFLLGWVYDENDDDAELSHANDFEKKYHYPT